MLSGLITRGIGLGLLASVLLVVALACGESEPDDSPADQFSVGESVPLAVECHTAYRSSVTVGIELEQTVELSSTEDTDSPGSPTLTTRLRSRSFSTGASSASWTQACLLLYRSCDVSHSPICLTATNSLRVRGWNQSHPGISHSKRLRFPLTPIRGE
jgi:hypothetical protein